MTIAQAAARMEKAATEHAKSTQSLRAAAVVIADKIVESVTAAKIEIPKRDGFALSRGYDVYTQHSNVGSFTQLRNERGAVLNSEKTKGGEYYLHGDFNRSFTVATRAEVLQFCRDCVAGLLIETADKIEKADRHNKRVTEEIAAL